jgi:hypothetical protein
MHKSIGNAGEQTSPFDNNNRNIAGISGIDDRDYLNLSVEDTQLEGSSDYGNIRVVDKDQPNMMENFSPGVVGTEEKEINYYLNNDGETVTVVGGQGLAGAEVKRNSSIGNFCGVTYRKKT